MSWHDLLAYILILATATAIPGPDVAAIVGSSLSSGLSRALTLIAGIIAGHAVWMVAAVTGLAAMAKALGPAFIIVKIVAVGYLLYLAWQLWTAHIGESPEADTRSRGKTRADILTGLMIALSNPKALVFFSAIVPTLLPVAKLGLSDLLFLIAVNSLTFIVIFGAWALLAMKARSVLTSAARRRGVNRASAVLIAGAGVAMAAR